MEEDLKTNDELKVNFPDDPMYVTTDDRREIIDNQIIEHGNITILNRFKNYQISLILSVVFYFIIRLIIGLIFNIFIAHPFHPFQ